MNRIFSIACLLLSLCDAKARGDVVRHHHPLADGGPYLITYVGVATEFDGQGITAEANPMRYEWDFDGDGETDWTSSLSGRAVHAYGAPGHYTAFFKATDLQTNESNINHVKVVVRPGAGRPQRILRIRRQRSMTAETFKKAKDSERKQHSLSEDEAEFLELSANEGGLPGQTETSRLLASEAANSMPADGVGKLYVVMINGGSETRFWEDVTYAYDMFRNKYGVSDEDIILLNYDGKNPSGENPNNMIDYATSKTNVRTAFTTISTRVDADDVLFVWITDHGRGYSGPFQHSSSQQLIYGYLDGSASVDPSDEEDYTESSFKLRALFSGGNNIGGHGMNQWITLDFPSSSIYYRHKFMSHFANVYIAEKDAAVSDNDVRIEEFIDYLEGDLNKDGKITAGEVKDFDGDGVPPYDPVTKTYDEDDWGFVDKLVDNVRTINTGVPEGFSYTYSILDLNLDDHVDIDLNFDPNNPEANGTDVDGDGLFDGMDVNDDKDKDDIVSIDEKICLYSGDMTDDEFVAALDVVGQTRATVVVMEQCFSGGFIWDLRRSDRIVMSATEAETVSYGNIFIRNVNAALSGATVPGSSGDPATADANHDGSVDMAETFQYASSNDTIKPYEIPQYEDNADGISHPDPIPNGGDGAFGSQIALDMGGADVTPPVIAALRVATVTATSAVVNWTTDEPATTMVEYGTTEALGFSTPLDQSLVVAHAAAITGLQPSTPYYYRVQSMDAAENVAVSATLSFTTPSVEISTPPRGLRIR